MNKSEQRSVDRVLPMVATQPAAVAAHLAAIHRATMATRTKRELENLIQKHELWSHLTVLQGRVIVAKEEAPKAASFKGNGCSGCHDPAECGERRDCVSNPAGSVWA